MWLIRYIPRESNAEIVENKLELEAFKTTVHLI